MKWLLVVLAATVLAGLQAVLPQPWLAAGGLAAGAVGLLAAAAVAGAAGLVV